MIIRGGAPNKKFLLGKKKFLKNPTNFQTNNENNLILNKNLENFSIESEKINYLTEGNNNSNSNDQQTKISREFETTENKGKFTILKQNNPKLNKGSKIIPININKPTTSGDEGLDHPVPLMSDYDEIRAAKYKNEKKEESKTNYIDDDDLDDPENKEIYLRVIEKFNKNTLPLNNKKKIIENIKKNYINFSKNVYRNVINKKNSKLVMSNRPKINVEDSNVNKSKYEKDDNIISPIKKVIKTTNNQNNYQNSYQKINNRGSQKKNNTNRSTPSKIPINNVSKTSCNVSNKKREITKIENDLRYKRQTVDRGGKYNNIQTTYIVYSKKKNCDIHLEKNYSFKRVESINKINRSLNNEYQNLKGKIINKNPNNRAAYNYYTIDKNTINNRSNEGINRSEINRGNRNTYSSYSYISKLNNVRNYNNRVTSINMNNKQVYGQYRKVGNRYNITYGSYNKGQSCSRSEKNMVLPNRMTTLHRYSNAGQ